MPGVQGSVGGENWCVYEDLDPYCDTAAIMSYGMAWAGSAPGPVFLRDWLEGIYNYATSVMSPKKIFLGLPGRSEERRVGKEERCSWWTAVRKNTEKNTKL